MHYSINQCDLPQEVERVQAVRGRAIFQVKVDDLAKNASELHMKWTVDKIQQVYHFKYELKYIFVHSLFYHMPFVSF